MRMGMAKALIIGVDSTIGYALAKLLRARGDQVIGSTRRNPSAPEKSCIFVDLAKSESATWNLPDADFAVICAAMSRQADCREKLDVARQVNVTTPVMLAERLVARGTRVIFLSSSAVFDGELPFAPADRATAPKSAYGMLKSEAEAAMLDIGRKVSILRMTKVIAPDMPLLARWIKSLARGGGISGVFRFELLSCRGRRRHQCHHCDRQRCFGRHLPDFRQRGYFLFSRRAAFCRAS